MNSQELQIDYVPRPADCRPRVWRDNGYGIIRWKQQLRFGRTSGVEFGNPDLVQYARSFGAAGYRVTEPTELQSILREALQQHILTVIACPIDYRDDLRSTERLNRLAP